jgi:hypothetical protein
MDIQNQTVYVSSHLGGALAREASLTLSGGRLLITRDGEDLIDAPVSSVQAKLKGIMPYKFVQLKVDSTTYRVYFKFPSNWNFYSDMMGSKPAAFLGSLKAAGAQVS